ncbi:endonuclease/exonuclease/phosphatase family protein [Pararhizobium sp. IMCC21322]|uniref:endonuclease/exonuclease/phosphatase family protein n=1 Tax=Pararhizobium sp. IMCC21322 TaxID=3067903 RepID=UPI00274099F1|nr:endonuclease/exonuclease/phosphatase family protein [Pararhizobium sp. IMCC21322]
MRVASYNIRKAVGLDWRRDPDRIVDVLAEIDADVVVLQEADRRAGSRAGVLPLDRLEQELGYEMVDVSVRPQSHGWHGNAILVRSSFVSWSSTRIEIPTVEPRGAVSMLLTDPKVEVVGVHLGLTPGMRRKQIEALRQLVDKRDHPVILAGDFNEWNHSRLVFDPASKVISPGPSFHAARPTTALDWFVLTGAVHAVSSHVHTSNLAERASDHLPIVIDIEFMENAQ